MKISHLGGMAAAAVFAAASFTALPAAAQATRTWVSGVGDDVNPCSRTAPCRTFAGTISKTAAGGEINCIDPGSYGTVTITKAIIIRCDEEEAGIGAYGVNGVNIVAGATDAIVLSGLDIQGGGSSGLGGNVGVRFTSGGSLTIQNSTIRHFTAGSAFGVQFAPSGAATLHIANTLISNNGASGVGGGVIIQPTGTGSAKVSIADSRLVNNTNTGFWMLSTGNTGTGNTANITDSVISNNAGSGVVVNAQTGLAVGRLVVDRSTASNNSIGIVSSGSGAIARVGGSVITGNTAFGVLTSASGVLASYGDNQLNGNATDGTFTAGVIAKQ